MALEKSQVITQDALNAPLELAENLRAVTKELKEIIAISAQSAKALGAGNATQQKQRQVVDDLTKANERLKKANSDVAREVAKVNIQTQERNKQVKQEARASLGLVGAYDKLTKELNDARKAYKNLAASGTATTKQLKDQQAVVTQLDRKVKMIDASVGQFQRNVGNYPKTFGAAANAVRGFIGAFGIIGGVQLLATTIKDVISTFRDFTKANSTLKAVSGSTKEELAALTAQQKALGQATEFSATEVAQAQIELARLGFTAFEINQATPAILNAATALETDLASAAELVASQLNAFQLEVTDTTKVVDTLVQAANIGAFDFERLSTSLGNVAPAAKAVGASLQETLAILGAAVDANIDASTAGASLRNIYIDLVDKGLTWEQAMNKIRGSSDKLAVANELFGKRGALVATVIADNLDKIEKNTVALNENGAAARFAASQLDNLDGDVKILGSTWEGLILQLTTGNGVFSDVTRGVVQLVTQFIKWIGTSDTVTQYLTYLATPARVLWRLIQLLTDVFSALNVQGGFVSEVLTVMLGHFKQFVRFIIDLPDILTGFAFVMVETFKVVRDSVVDSFRVIEDVIRAAFDPTVTIKDVLTRAVNQVENYGKRIAKAYYDGFNKYRKQVKPEEEIPILTGGEGGRPKPAGGTLEGGDSKLTKEAIAESELQRKGRIAALERQMRESTDLFAQETEAFKEQKKFQEDINKRFNERLIADGKKRSDQEKAQQQADLEAQQAYEDRRNEIIAQSFQLGSDIANEFFGNRQQKLEEELAMTQARREAELEAAGDDERRKLAINRKFDQEEAKIKAKQARNEKANALFNIAIQTAQNITRYVGGLPFTAPLLALAIATGAVQAALVAARPIPKFWKGSDSTPDTFIAGDRGRELVVHNGQATLTDNKPTLFTGMQGAVVLPHPRTEEILGSIGDADISRSILRSVDTRQTANWSKIEQQLDENNKLLSQLVSKPVSSWAFDRHGIREFVHVGRNKSESMNKRFGNWY